MNSTFDGLVLIDKPAGPTSHDIVAAVRRASGQRRTGHTGTLDPPATGLLVLALGRATRLIRFLPESPKSYSGTIALGVTTDTDDLAGNVLETARGPLPELELVRATSAEFLGRLSQVPPTVSARKVAGQRLYRLARRGTPVTAPPSDVEVFRFELTGEPERGRFTFEAEVSKGTYIRSLARDLGRRLGCGGALAELRRTAIGPFSVTQADGMPERAAGDWNPSSSIPLERIPLTPPPFPIELDDVDRFVHGGGISVSGQAEGWVRVLAPEERLLGVGHIENGELSPRVVVVDPA